MLVKAIEASTKAKIDIAIDTPGTLAKLEDFSKAFFARLHKAYGHGASLEDFKARIEADTEAI